MSASFRLAALPGLLAALGIPGCAAPPPESPGPGPIASGAMLPEAMISEEAVAGAIAAITAASARARVEALLALGLRPAADPVAARRTLDHLRALLEGWGYAVREESFAGAVPDLEWRNDGGFSIVSVEVPLANLIAERRGARRPEEVVEVSAHYDTIFDSPGADDNTSGVAGALEIARALAPLELDRTIRFCFFAAEEHGLLGSRHHVARIEKGREGTLVALLNLEMIGFTNDEPGSQRSPMGIGRLIGAPPTGTFIAVLGTPASAELGEMVVAAMADHVPELEVFGLPRLGSWFPDSHRSDHGAYWRAGLPAVMLTDTAEFRNPHYHQTTDTIDTLDFEFLARVARGVAAAMIRRADPHRDPAPRTP